MSMMLRWWVWVCLVGVLVVGCEPLAPDENRQAAVIVITATATDTLPPSPTPPLATGIPTRAPTATPTVPATIAQPTVPPCDEATGRVINSSLVSAVSGGLEVPYRVYVPPCFFQTLRRYPYVILLHGSGYDYTQWTDGLGIQSVLDNAFLDPNGTLPPMVVVMPEGGDLQEFNYFEAGLSFEDLILAELMPEIERQFCVRQDSTGRAIGGISRGGFWAFSIALRNPDVFGAVGGHSPWFDADNAPPTHNPLALAQSVPNVPFRVYLDHARADLGADNVIAFSNALRTANVAHQYEVSPTGGHDNPYWSEQLPNYLAFYGAAWARNPNDLPSCFE